MTGRIEALPVGSCAVIIRMGKTPHLQAWGLRVGALVCCKYKSRGVMVLETGKRLLAFRRQALRSVWVDY